MKLLKFINSVVKRCHSWQRDKTRFVSALCLSHSAGLAEFAVCFDPGISHDPKGMAFLHLLVHLSYKEANSIA